MARTIFAAILVLLLLPAASALTPLVQLPNDFTAATGSMEIDPQPKSTGDISTQPRTAGDLAKQAPANAELGVICETAIELTRTLVGRNYQREGPIATPYSTLLAKVNGISGQIDHIPVQGTVYWYKWTPATEKFTYTHLVTLRAAAEAPFGTPAVVQVCDGQTILPNLPPIGCPGYEECAHILPAAKEEVKVIAANARDTGRTPGEYDCPTRYAERDDDSDEANNEQKRDNRLIADGSQTTQQAAKQLLLSTPIAWDAILEAAATEGLVDETENVDFAAPSEQTQFDAKPNGNEPPTKISATWPMVLAIIAAAGATVVGLCAIWRR